MTTMTTVDPVRAFMEALPRHVRQRIGTPGHRLVGLIHRAALAGLDLPELATRAASGITYRWPSNPADLVAFRVQRACGDTEGDDAR